MNCAPRSHKTFEYARGLKAAEIRAHDENAKRCAYIYIYTHTYTHAHIAATLNTCKEALCVEHAPAQVHNSPGRHSTMNGRTQTRTHNTYEDARSNTCLRALNPRTYSLACLHETVSVTVVLKSASLQLSGRVTHMSDGVYAHTHDLTHL